MDTITFTYNPFGYVHSFENVIKNIRKFYQHETIFVYTDSAVHNLSKIQEISDKYSCNKIHSDIIMHYIEQKDPFDVNIQKMREWINRLINTCVNSDSTWVMLVEDDVLIKKQIESWPKSDCGTNRHDVGFLGGGSIFKREKFLEIINYYHIDEILHKDHRAVWAGDVLLQYVFKENNATYEKWLELGEPGYFEGSCSVFHGYKDLHHLG
jgi:hypothetical protein